MMISQIRRLVGALASIVLLSACQHTQWTTPEDLAEGLLSGQIDPERYDFVARRFSSNSDVLANVHAILTQNAAHDCSPREIARLRSLPWVELARAVGDSRSLSEEVAALRRQSIELDDAVRVVRSGRPSARITSEAITMTQQNMASTEDTRVRELFARVIEDQALRAAYGPTWTSTLPPLATEQWRIIVTAKLVSTDCNNTAWLKSELEALDWFDVARFGYQADSAAWLIAQHSDRDRQFQQEVLRRLERLAPDSLTAGRNVAALSDRIAVAEGRQQLFGSQVRCHEGEWIVVNGVDDPENLNPRRARIGLGTWESYRDRLPICAHD